MATIRRVILYTIILSIAAHETTIKTADHNFSNLKVVGASLLTASVLCGSYYKMYGNPFAKKSHFDHLLQNKIQWALSARQVQDIMFERTTHNTIISDHAAFFGIYDGDRGTKASLAAAGKDEPVSLPYAAAIPSLYQCIIERLRESNSIEKAVEEGFIDFDKNFFKKYCDSWGEDSGTTALTTLVTNDGKEDIVTIAWAGNSRAIVIDDQGKVIFSTRDHKPNDPDEIKRIEAVGGKITSREMTSVFTIQGSMISSSGTHTKKTRDLVAIAKEKKLPLTIKNRTEYCVNDSLLTSRALGYVAHKKNISSQYERQGPVTAEPEIVTLPIKPNNIKYIILGSKGLWDEANDDAIIKGEKIDLTTAATPSHIELSPDNEGNNDDLKHATQILRDEAYDRLSTSNISVMAIKFD